jgi:hypothetical protein
MKNFLRKIFTLSILSLPFFVVACSQAQEVDSMVEEIAPALEVAAPVREDAPSEQVETPRLELKSPEISKDVIVVANGPDKVSLDRPAVKSPREPDLPAVKSAPQPEEGSLTLVKTELKNDLFGQAAKRLLADEAEEELKIVVVNPTAIHDIDTSKEKDDEE